jgi:putative transposase
MPGGERWASASWISAVGKNVNGRKRHMVVDTCGLLLVVLVTGAHVWDRDAVVGACARWSEDRYSG